MRTKQETCCFTGHRPTKLPWRYNEMDCRCLALKRRIRDAVETAYEQGYRHFICGMAEGCDLYFCECVLTLRDSHPDVTVEAAIPCPSQADDWSLEQQRRYAELVEKCDFETMISSKYTSSCMQRRDRYMVDRASLLIAVFNGSSGGTRYTMQYAIDKKILVVDLRI